MITKLLSTLSRFALPLLIFDVILITVLSFISIRNLPKINTGYDDKIFHALSYSVFVLLVFNYLQKLQVKNAVWISMLATFIYGTIIEILQKVLTTHRTFDVFDMVANGAGILLGFYIIKRLYKLKLN